MFFLSVPSTEAGGCEVSSEHEPHMSRGGITAEMQVCVRACVCVCVCVCARGIYNIMGKVHEVMIQKIYRIICHMYLSQISSIYSATWIFTIAPTLDRYEFTHLSIS